MILPPRGRDGDGGGWRVGGGVYLENANACGILGEWRPTMCRVKKSGCTLLVKILTKWGRQLALIRQRVGPKCSSRKSMALALATII